MANRPVHEIRLGAVKAAIWACGHLAETPTGWARWGKPIFVACTWAAIGG